MARSRKKMAKIAVEGRKGTAGSFIAIVNRDLTLKEMISAGKYDRVCPCFSEKNFPIKGKGSAKTVFEIFHFNCEICSDDVVKEMTKQGLRPADIADFLVFLAEHPDEKEKHLLVELGSVAEIKGFHCVAFFVLWGSKRELRPAYGSWSDGLWDPAYRFLAVRPPATPRA